MSLANDELPLNDRTELQDRLQVVFERGKAIIPALRALSDELPRGGRRRKLNEVIAVLERGDASETMAAIRSLPDYWIPLVCAAASSNNPERLLREFFEESQKSEELHRQWYRTLAYPLIVCGLAAVVITALLFFIVPAFITIFNDFEVVLPSLTVLVIRASQFVTGGLLPIFLVSVFVAGLVLRQLPRLLPRRWWDWWTDRFATRIGRATTIARFSRFMADLLEAGIGIPDSLRVAGVATQRSRISRGASRLASDLESNRDITEGGYERFLSGTVLFALRSDLPTTTRVYLLRELSTAYADRARLRMSWTSGIVEPLAICLVGLLVGGMVIGLFLPLVKLVQSLT